MGRRLRASIEESIVVQQAMLASMLEPMLTAADWLTAGLQAGQKLLLFGNGGSAAAAQHMAAEFVGRFETERRAWPAIALTTDTAILTALGNNYGVGVIFARQIEALGQRGDVVLAFSASGNAVNVLEGVRAARAKGLRVIGCTGAGVASWRRCVIWPCGCRRIVRRAFRKGIW
jgi:D-sedoheptulose 7-phosphate isomerase